MRRSRAPERAPRDTGTSGAHPVRLGSNLIDWGADYSFTLGQRTADCGLRTADQRHCGLLTNCGLGDLLRIDDWNCGLRTAACPQCAVSPPIRSYSPNSRCVSST